MNHNDKTIPAWDRERAQDRVSNDPSDGRVRRRIENQLRFLEAAEQAMTMRDACEAAGVHEATVGQWRKKDTIFRRRYDRLVQLQKNKRRATQLDPTNVFDPDRERPERLPFPQWRRRYTGRSTPDCHMPLVRALEDRTNRFIFVLGPPEMGKDTTIGDVLLMESTYDPSLRCAWFMESADFSKRRIKQRLDPYLTDPRTYEAKPDGDDSAVPEGNLISELGPFKWRKGMVYANGDSVERRSWTANEMYYVTGGAPEADPNLWATGVGGATYGSRIDFAGCSDLFTKENQVSPTTMQGQFSFVTGTLDTRIGRTGRVVFMGTRIKKGDNWERLIAHYAADSPVVYQDETTTKYASGVCVILIRAIQLDDDGNEVSFWPQRFRLDSYFQMPDGSEEPMPEDPVHILDIGARGGRLVEGLRAKRARLGDEFDTMYQQDPPEDLTGDFTDQVLEAAMRAGAERSYETAWPEEVVIVGADPARTAGAAWAAVACDRERQTMTVVDWWWGKNLGTSGIKAKLLAHPISKWTPLYYGYEVNRESAVLDDTEMRRLFEDFAVTLYRHQTHAGNRSRGPLSVASLSSLLRSGRLAFPSQTHADRERSRRLFEHFRAWDARSHAEGRTRPGQKGHDPDDAAFAVWIAVIKGVEFLGRGGGRARPSMPVPADVRAKWDAWQRRRTAERTGRDSERHRHAPIDNAEAVTLAIGGPT